MKHRLGGLFIAVLPLSLVIISACSGDGGSGELTLEEYFQRFDATKTTASGELERMETEARESFEAVQTDEEAADILQNMFATTDELTRQHVADLEDIDPPAPARQAHDEYVAVELDGLGLWGSLNERAQRTSSPDELNEIVDEIGPALADMLDREREACLGLQAIADDNDIDVDLGCPE